MTYIHAFISMLNAMAPYLLLGFLIAGVLRAFVPPAVYGRYLSGTGWRSVVTAALVGIPLPLCSCGVLPTAVALRRSGASRAACASFLIATPQTGVDSIAATYGMMGLPFAILRPVAALVTALCGGMAVGRYEKRGALPSADVEQTEPEPLPRGLKAKLWLMLRYGFFEMMQNIGKWLLLGLVIATLITVLLPDNFFTAFARYPLLNMLIIVAVAVPMYVCATGSIPIAAALMLKGMSPGCALVLLMAGPAANLASMMVVSRTFGKKTMLIYVASIVLGAIGFGVIVDYWPGLREVFTNALPAHTMHHAMATSWFTAACGVLLLALIVFAMASKYFQSHKVKQQNNLTTMKSFKVDGMMCNHCRDNVKRSIMMVPGVTNIIVDLEHGMVWVDGDASQQDVMEAIVRAGYTPYAMD